MRSIAIILPVLFSAGVSSLVFVPSSCLTLTTRALLQQQTWSRDKEFPLVQVTSRNNARGRRSLATLITENPEVTTVGSDDPVVTASEWRRLAGFQPDPPSSSTGRISDGGDYGVTHHSPKSATEVHGNEEREIHKLQQQARAVAQKYVAAPNTAQEQATTAATASKSASPSGGGAGGRSGSVTIHLKKPLVTNVFSTPAVANRRRSKASTTTGESHLQQPLLTESSKPIESPTAERAILSNSKNADSPPDLVQHSTQPPHASAVPVMPHLENLTEVMNAPPLETEASVGSHAPLVTRTQVTLVGDSDSAVSAPIEPAEATPVAMADRVAASPTTTAGEREPSVPPRRVTTLSDRVRRLRSQPKSAMVESLLQARYAAISDVGMRAYQILLDLEMIVPTPDPNDPKYDNSCDDELAPENNYIIR